MSYSDRGVDIIGLSCITFIILKLCHVISWSWIWVLSPIWISLVIAGIIILIFYRYMHKHFDNTKTL